MVEFLPLLPTIMVLPFVGMLFALLSKEDERFPGRNVFNVSFFAISFNIILILRALFLLDSSHSGLQLLYSWNWLELPEIHLIFGADIFSLILVFASHLAVLIGLVGARDNTNNQKSLMVFTLLFLSMLTGFFIAGDILSFYLFFEAMLLPLFMIIGIYGGIKKKEYITHFFLYNFIGSVFLFAAIIIIYNFQDKSILITSVSNNLNLHKDIEAFVWISIFISFISRIPIWPFHYWISSISGNVKNPLVFIIANLVPLTAIYGFARFLPQNMPDSISGFIAILQIVAVVSMLFIALIGFINKDTQQKMFSYITVYYIIYLLAVFLKEERIFISIAFSSFSYLLIISALTLLFKKLDEESHYYGIKLRGILCHTPRTSFIFSFLVLAGVGLPVSSLFLSNFVLLSNILNYNIKTGSFVVLSLALVSATLLQEFYKLKNPQKIEEGSACIPDISIKFFCFMLFIVFLLVLSFINPLWILKS